MTSHEPDADGAAATPEEESAAPGDGRRARRARAADRGGSADSGGPEDPEGSGRPGDPEDPQSLGDLGDPEDPQSLGDLGDPEEPEEPEEPKKKTSLLKETAIVLVGALVLSFLLKTFLVQAFYIPSGSMEITLLEGDRILANKLAPGPFELHRGDIVVFADSQGWLGPRLDEGPTGVVGVLEEVAMFIGVLPSDAQEHLIKRVIGTPGDEVACCSPEGRLTVNGTAIDEPYLYPGDVPSTEQFDVTVPAGHLWVMGDHRSNSQDSRAHQGEVGKGFVPVSDVVGVAFVKTWPLNRIGLLRNPADVFADVPAPASTPEPAASP